jgi:hypothetical protein
VRKLVQKIIQTAVTKVRIRNARLRALFQYLKTEVSIIANSTDFLNRMLGINLSASPGFTEKTPEANFLLCPNEISLPHSSTPVWNKPKPISSSPALLDVLELLSQTY